MEITKDHFDGQIRDLRDLIQESNKNVVTIAMHQELAKNMVSMHEELARMVAQGFEDLEKRMDVKQRMEKLEKEFKEFKHALRA